MQWQSQWPEILEHLLHHFQMRTIGRCIAYHGSADSVLEWRIPALSTPPGSRETMRPIEPEPQAASVPRIYAVSLPSIVEGGVEKPHASRSLVSIHAHCGIGRPRPFSDETSRMGRAIRGKHMPWCCT